jgi:peptidoglycan/LPS O-acetylase OafA/YrhL
LKILVYRNYVAAALKSEASIATSKFLSLEAFRGIAAIMIVLYHSRYYAREAYVSFIRHSDIFVDFFFILSGFVMAYSYMDKIGSKITFRKFILLRFGRLYPLHLFTLLLWVPYIAVKVALYQKGIGDTDPSQDNNFLTFLSNVFLIQAFDGYYPLSWNFPSWSISAEFYTYIVFFIFIWFMLKKLLARNNIGSFIFLVAAGTYGLISVIDESGVELFLFQSIAGFFTGILIFLLYQKTASIRWNSIFVSALELVALSFLVYCVSNKQEPGFRGNTFFYLSVFSFACVIYLFVVQEIGYISRFLKNTVLQFIGKLSYSIYMVHAIVLAAMDNVFVYIFKFSKTSFEGAANVIVFHEANYVNFAVVLIVIFCSAFTYQFVEVPWRTRFKKLAEKL